uniref:Uncharacterized protein n=1 Tax=viral metagenome TaxID=1070528 RepID=A0A6C0DTZ2_9ZZZZ
MKQFNLIILLFLILILYFSFLLFFFGNNVFHQKSANLENLETLYSSVKAASDAEATLITAIQTAANNPNILAAIAQLPDGGADIRNKMNTALSTINDALLGATYYTGVGN